MSFAHLHVHTHYSLLDSINKPQVLFEKAAKLDIPAMAITEHGNMFSAVECARIAEEVGVKWIPGLEAYFRPDNREKVKPNHVTLLAISDQGYRNLCKLSSRSWEKTNFYYKPCVDFTLLDGHSDGIVCLSGCMAGFLSRLFQSDKDKEAYEWASRYVDIFGDRFFVEVWNHKMQEQATIYPRLIKLADHFGVKIVATGDCHYTESDQFHAHATLVGIGRKCSPEEAAYPSEEFELKSPADMRKLWQSRPDACDNTLLIADWCDFKLDTKTKHAPRYGKGDPSENVKTFRKLVLRGFKEKYGPKPKEEQVKRLKYEVSVIEKLGFVDYFLILWDLMKHCREVNIPVGPGRGSAAGAMVTYALDITRLEPLRYGLLFERFLNEDRVSDPDIDIDFCMERRSEVVEYLRNRYGSDNVAKIATFSLIHAKGALKDVGRVLNIDFDRVNQLTRMVEDDKMDLRDFLKEENRPSFAHEIPKFEGYINTAADLQEICRHRSVHAAGVLIGDQPLIDLVPLCQDKKHGTVCQYSMEDAEAVGLLKMDILGLETLTVINRCLEFIPEDKRPDLEAIISQGEFDDDRSWKLLQSAQAAGIFQVESFGMRQILSRVQPNCLEDLTAILALYRPGPLDAGMVDEYIERKNGTHTVEYLHPDLEPILKNTYGIIVYQEQIMQLAVKLCGYTLPEADVLRKVIGKKQLDKVAKEGEKFRTRALSTGLGQGLVDELWRQIETFGRYGFNKSHSASYAVISYLTAYLKANYTLYYMASVLTAKLDDRDKFKRFVYETVQRCGIPVMPPHVNSSMPYCTVGEDGNYIRAGLMAVAGIAENAGRTIVVGRGDRPFKNLDDFTTRCKLTKKAIVALIDGGALDGVIYNRRSAVEGLDDLLKQKKGNGVALFDIETKIEELDEYDKDKRRSLEETSLGMPVLKKK